MSSILLKNKGITLFYSYGGTSNYEVFKNDTSKATRSLENNSGIIIPRVSLSWHWAVGFRVEVTKDILPLIAYSETSDFRFVAKF